MDVLAISGQGGAAGQRGVSELRERGRKIKIKKKSEGRHDKMSVNGLLVVEGMEEGGKEKGHEGAYVKSEHKDGWE